MRTRDFTQGHQPRTQFGNPILRDRHRVGFFLHLLGQEAGGTFVMGCNLGSEALGLPSELSCVILGLRDAPVDPPLLGVAGGLQTFTALFFLLNATAETCEVLFQPHRLGLGSTLLLEQFGLHFVGTRDVRS